MDLWVGGQGRTSSETIRVEESLTHMDGATIIVNPDSTHPVISGAIVETGFSGQGTITTPTTGIPACWCRMPP